MAVGTNKGPIYILDANTGNTINTLIGHTDWVTSTAWSPDSRWLATVSQDKTVRIWDVQSGKNLFALAGHSALTTAIAWSQDGSNVISGDIGGDDSNTIHIWDAVTGHLLETRNGGTTRQMVHSPDGTKLAIAYVEAVQIVDATNFKILGSIEYSNIRGGRGYDIQSVAWSLDNRRIATGTLNGNVRIWDSSTRKVLIDIWVNNSHEGEINGVASLQFSPDGTRLLTISDGHLRTWNAITGQLLEVTPITASVLSWSPFLSRLAFFSVSETSATLTSSSIANSALQVIVPYASLANIRALATACVEQPSVQQALISRINAASLQDFVDTVKQLSNTQILPACAADLIAVANALQKGKTP